jgi:hypothetical protein
VPRNADVTKAKALSSCSSGCICKETKSIPPLVPEPRARSYTPLLGWLLPRPHWLKYLTSSLTHTSSLSLSWPPLPMSSSPSSDETVNDYQSDAQHVGAAADRGALFRDRHDIQLDFPEGGRTAWGTALGA